MRVESYTQRYNALNSFGDAIAWQLYKEVVNFHGERPPSRNAILSQCRGCDGWHAVEIAT